MGQNRLNESEMGFIGTDQGQKNEPGAGSWGMRGHTGLALSKAGEIGERIIDAKVTRYIAGIYNLNIWGLTFLGALESCLILHERENVGLPDTVVIDWTGRKPNWLRAMREGLEECEALGLVERIPVSGGSVIDITHAGRKILNEYNRKFQEIREGLEARRIELALRAETARIKRENAKALRLAAGKKR